MTTANMNGGGDGDQPEAPQQVVNPYLNMNNPEEPQLCGFGMSFLGVLSQMVNQYQIMPQQMIEALTPPVEERVEILRDKAAEFMQAAQDLETSADAADPNNPQWGSKWKN